MEKKLENIVRYAYTSSPFYMQVLQKDNKSLEQILKNWDEVSVVSKDAIVEGEQSIVPYSYYPELSKGKIAYAMTSGSTGKCLQIYWRKSDMNRSMLPLWIYRKKYYDIGARDKFCFFYTVRNTHGAEVLEERIGNSLGFSKINFSSERVRDIVQSMQAFQPVWLLLQPSIAMILAEVDLGVIHRQWIVKSNSQLERQMAMEL